MDGTEGQKCENLPENLQEKLQNLCEIDIKFVDERLTTVSANRTLNELERTGQ